MGSGKKKVFLYFVKTLLSVQTTHFSQFAYSHTVSNTILGQ